MSKPSERDRSPVEGWLDFATIVLVGSYVSLWAWLQTDLAWLA